MDDFLIFTEGETYSRYRYTGSRAELEFQESIVNYSENLFPSFHVFQWSKHLKAKRMGIIEGVACDIVMIHKKLKEWWIVEVERIEHDIHDHVLDQMDRLISSHEYNSPETIEHIIKVMKRSKIDADYEELKVFLYQNHPEFLIIDESYVESRKNEVSSFNKFKKVDLRYSSLTRYKSKKNKFTFLKSGFNLEEKIMPEIRIKIDNGGNLVIPQPRRLNINFKQGQEVNLIYGRKITTWDVYEAMKTITLTASCDISLSFKSKMNQRFKLVYSESEEFYKII